MAKSISPILFSLMLCITGSLYAQKNNLTVEIKGFENIKATKIMVSVFSKDNFLDTSPYRKSVPASGNKVSVNFNLPPGEYAVATYHDLNNNKELDRRFYGKPKEPYGFSNNVRPFGKPKFDKCKFSINTSSKVISINLKD